MSIEKVVIIIPTYNEALVIESTIDKIFQSVAANESFDIHVLIFDSNSTDNTQSIVSKLQNQYQNLHLRTELQKSGLGAAYLQAMRYALNEMSADIIFEFDADCSHQPKYLLPMLEKIKAADVVVGSRYVRGGSIPKNWGWHRKLISVFGNYVSRLFLTPKYRDFTSGFRATRRQAALDALPEKFLSNHYAYKLQFLWLLHQNKSRIVEFPIDFLDREKGVSKLPSNSVADSLRVLFILRFQALNEYLRMCVVGLSGATLQFIVFNLLRQTMTPFNAAQFAVIAAILCNFALNNRFVFRKRLGKKRFQKISSLGLFLGYSALMINVQSYWLSFGVHIFGQGYIKENLLMMTGIVLGSFLNYKLYSGVIWKRPKSPLGDFVS